MNIDKLEAGPETDALVAEKVMGWILDPDYGDPGLWKDSTGMLTGWCSKEWSEESLDEYSPHYAGCAPELFTPKGIFRPSADWSAAWEMEEVIEQRGFNLRYTQELMAVFLFDGFAPVLDEELWWGLVHASSSQRCRAALKAVNGG